MFTLSPACDLNDKETVWVWNSMEGDGIVNVFLKSYEVQSFVDQKYNVHHG
jgi:hypothetical protein